MRQPVRTLPYFATAMKYVESWRQYGKYLNILQTLPYYTCCFLPQIFYFAEICQKSKSSAPSYKINKRQSLPYYNLLSFHWSRQIE